MQLMKIYQGNGLTGFTQFSKLTVHNGVSYWTGHVALGPGDTYEQTKSTLIRYDVFLPMFGQRKDNVLQGMVFLRDIGQYPEFLRAWTEWFPIKSSRPALTCVQADLSPGHNVEICLIAACCGEDGITPSVKRLEEGPESSRCVMCGGLARFSAFTADGQNLDGGVAEEFSHILQQYDQFFARHGLAKRNLLMANVYLNDVNEWQQICPLWTSWIGEDQPALLIQGARCPDEKQVAVSLILSADEHAEIERLDRQAEKSSCVKCNGVAFLSGVVSDISGTANQEGEEVFQKIDRMLQQYGIEKKNVYFNQMFGNNFPDFHAFDVGAFKEWSVNDHIFPSAIGFSSQPPYGKAIIVSVTAAYE